MITAPARPAGFSAASRETFRLLANPTLLAWALYLVLVPIYLWKSGVPQPGDWLIIALAPMALFKWNGRLPPTVAPTIRALLVFTAYVVVINLFWSIALGRWNLNLKKGFGLSPVFYIYNALVFLIVLVLYRRWQHQLLWFTGKIVLVSLLAQFAAAFILPSGIRATVLFNNPNQLGYFALLSASILLFLQGRKYVTTVEVMIGSVAASYLALISASKAALGGVGLLVIAGLIVRLRTMLLVATTFLLVLVVSNPMQEAIDNTLTRFETDQSYGFLEERGYDRIWQHPQYWVLGSGEGAYDRFHETTMIGDHEIHSSIGTLFFSYGGVGLILFAVFLWTVLRGSGLRTWIMVAPSLAYGMTHQGLRFTLFWVMLALIVCLRVDAMVNGPPARR